MPAEQSVAVLKERTYAGATHALSLLLLLEQIPVGT